MKSNRFFRMVVFACAVLASAESGAQALIQVPAQMGLQQAIGQVSEGGVIEIAAGSYTAPANGFDASNLTKSFTIRAAPSASVTLNGNNNTPILRVANGSTALGRPISLERLTFANGRTTSNTLGGALTLVAAQITLINCTFQSNVAAPPSGGGGGGAISAGGTDLTIVGSSFTGNGARVSAGGGAIRATYSRLLVLDSTFSTNDAWESGGALALFGSTIFVHNSLFSANRANPPNHFVNSLGGAITMADSKLSVTNSRFSGNQAGYSGGAIYAYGYWTTPEETVVVTANSTFIDNAAQRDASVSGSGLPIGGAIQVEDQVILRSYNTRFITNHAEIGGAISSYRSITDIVDSAFHGNYATGLAPGAALGGAIASASQDADAIDGQNNRRNASLTVRNTLFQGRFGSVGNVARTGGCVFAAGDPVRAYGLSGNTQMGSVASNRAPVSISNSVFYDCDVQQNQEGGIGGGAIFQLASVQIHDTIFAGCDALNNAVNTGSGGAIMMYDNTDASILRSSFIGGRAGFVGGAITAQGSNLQVSDSNFADNRLVGPNPWGGAAIWSGWENLGAPRPGANATGLVQNSVFSNNTGGPVLLEYDSANAPFNLMRYSTNRAFPDNSSFFSNALTAAQTVAQLNSLVLHGTAKAPSPNQGLATVPVIGAVQSAPPRVLPTNAVGDPAQPTAAYIGYAWSGGNATLDGNAVSGGFGLVSAGPGTHTLNVAGNAATTAITQGVAPATTLRALPYKVGLNQTSRQLWTTLTGTFLDQFIDQRANLVAPTASGSQVVGPTNATTVYRSLLVAEEGGAVAASTVIYVADLIFADGYE